MLAQVGALAGIGAAARWRATGARAAAAAPGGGRRAPLTRHRALAATLTQLAVLGQPEAYAALLDVVAEVVTLDETRCGASQWKIARRSGEAVRRARAMCAEFPITSSSSDETFRAVLLARDELVPRLQSQLDDLLHNHLLG